MGRRRIGWSRFIIEVRYTFCRIWQVNGTLEDKMESFFLSETAKYT